MRRITSTMAAACAALALTAGLATAQTVPPDRLTYVTFSGPVTVPGMTLPGGTYAFKIMDSNTDRHVVQIFNRDQTKLFTTLLAVPATRMQPTGDPVITFKETRSDQPPAVHYWYYAGDLAGNELVYPKNQAQMIANASGESVMSVDSEGSSIDDWKKGSISRVKPENTATATTGSETPAAQGTTGAQSSAATTSTTTADTSAQQPQSSATSSTTTQPAATTADQKPRPATTTADQTAQPTTATPPPPAPTTAPQPSQTMDQSAQPTTAPTPAPSTADNTVGTSGHAAASHRSLPKTASELPLVGLIGLLALGGALAFRVARTA